MGTRVPIAIWAHVHVKEQRKAQFSNSIAAFFNGLVMELQLSLSTSKFETHIFPSWIISSQAGDDSNQSWDILEPRLVQHNLVGQDVPGQRGHWHSLHFTTILYIFWRCLERISWFHEWPYILKQKTTWSLGVTWQVLFQTFLSEFYPLSRFSRNSDLEIWREDGHFQRDHKAIQSLESSQLRWTALLGIVGICWYGKTISRAEHSRVVIVMNFRLYEFWWGHGIHLCFAAVATLQVSIFWSYKKGLSLFVACWTTRKFDAISRNYGNWLCRVLQMNGS